MLNIFSHSNRVKTVSNGLLSVVLTASMLAGKTIPSNTMTTLNDGGNKNITFLTIKRSKLIKNGRLGELYVNENFVCYTLENDTLKIPPGSYNLTRTQKGFRLHKVPGRYNVNIEIGNYPFESLGCIFVGTKITDVGVEGSKIALLRLIRLVKLPAVVLIS